MEKNIILREKDISDSIRDMARHILETNTPLKDIVLVGIRTGGAYLASRLREVFEDLDQPGIPVGILDITMYRDDWTKIGPAPVVGRTELPKSINDKTVILVDDVLFTGRTVRAAMDALMDFGRPSKIELAVLVDRGDQHRELPITPNYVGGTWETSADETINVYLKEAGYFDHAAIERKKAA